MTTTKFARGQSPWEPKKPRQKKPSVNVDIKTIEVGEDPLPDSRVINMERKYDALFSSLKPGQCIRCQPEDMNKVANAMRVWIRRTKLADHVVRSCTSYAPTSDKPSRVWLIDLGSGRSKKAVAA